MRALSNLMCSVLKVNENMIGQKLLHLRELKITTIKTTKRETK